MKQLKFASLALLATLLGGMHSAMALSTENGNSVPGSYVNMADPDEQVPALLKSPDEQGASSNASHFDSGNSGPVIVRPNMLRQNPGMPFSPFDQSGSQR